MARHHGCRDPQISKTVDIRFADGSADAYMYEGSQLLLIPQSIPQTASKEAPSLSMGNSWLLDGLLIFPLISAIKLFQNWEGVKCYGIQVITVNVGFASKCVLVSIEMSFPYGFLYILSVPMTEICQHWTCNTNQAGFHRCCKHCCIQIYWSHIHISGVASPT